MNIHYFTRLRNLLAIICCCTCSLVLAEEYGSELQGEPITLEIAVGKAIESNPELAAAHTRIAVREAERRQAGLLPNPRFSYEAENFGGRDELSRFRSVEQKVALSQELELGGKRGRRKVVADHGRTIAELRYRAAYLDLVARVESSFYELLTAQRLDSLATEKVRLAHEVYNTVSERLRAGKVSPVELARAEVALSRADIETVRAEANLLSARQRLAATWGARDAWFGLAEGDFDVIDPPGELPVLVPRLDDSPDMMIMRQQLDGRKAEEKLASAHRIPNLEISAGVKSMRDSGNRAFVAQIGIPLPLFDRNQGNLAASRHSVAQAAYESQGKHSQLVAELTATHADLQAAYSVAISLRDRVVAGVERVFFCH